MDTDTVQLGDLKNVHEKASYTNDILNTIAEQLNQLSAKIDSKKEIAMPVQNPPPLQKYSQSKR